MNEKTTYVVSIEFEERALTVTWPTPNTIKGGRSEFKTDPAMRAFLREQLAELSELYGHARVINWHGKEASEIRSLYADIYLPNPAFPNIQTWHIVAKLFFWKEVKRTPLTMRQQIIQAAANGLLKDIETEGRENWNTREKHALRDQKTLGQTFFVRKPHAPNNLLGFMQGIGLTLTQNQVLAAVFFAPVLSGGDRPAKWRRFLDGLTDKQRRVLCHDTVMALRQLYAEKMASGEIQPD